jgi:hypothetical protein
MKTIYVFVLSLLTTVMANAQDYVTLMKEGEKLEQAFKEDEARAKYAEAFKIMPSKVDALIRLSELCNRKGARYEKNADKKGWFEAGKTYADAALKLDSNNYYVFYVFAISVGNIALIADTKKEQVQYVKLIKTYAEKSIQLNPNFAKAYHLLGRWNLEINNLGGLKKLAIKTFYGGMPAYSLADAIKHMEKCKQLDPYFVINYYDLARAYNEDNQKTKAQELLNAIAKLPNRTMDDAKYKADAKKMLDDEFN